MRFARSTAANIVVRASSSGFSHPVSWYACPGVRYVCQIMSLPMNSRTFFRRWSAAHGLRDAGDRLVNAQAAQAARLVDRLDLEPRRLVPDGLGFRGDAGAWFDRVDRAQQSWAICREILNREALHGTVPRGQHRCEVVRTEGLDRVGRDFPGGDGWLFRRDRTVQEDDEQPPVFPGCLVRDRVWRNIAGPHWRRRQWPRELHGSECPDRRLDPVVQNGEVGGAQPRHRPPLVVEHGDVELDELDAGAELRTALLLSGEARHRRQDAQAGEADSGQRMIVTDLKTCNVLRCWVQRARRATCCVLRARAVCYVLRATSDVRPTCSALYEHVARAHSTAARRAL